MLSFYILELTKDCNGEVVEFMKKFNIKHSFMLTGFAFMVTTSLFSQAHAEGNHPIDIFSKDQIDRNTAKSNIINRVNDTSRTGISMNSDNDLDTDIVSNSDSENDIFR